MRCQTLVAGQIGYYIHRQSYQWWFYWVQRPRPKWNHSSAVRTHLFCSCPSQKWRNLCGHYR